MKFLRSFITACGVTATAFLIVWMMMELITSPMSLDPSGPGRAYSDLAPLHRMGLCAIIALGMVVPGWIKSYLRRPRAQ